MDNLRDLYQDVVLDHGKHPRNFGNLDGASHTAHGRNPLCGDTISVFLNVKDNVIQQCQFAGKGCAISTASASIMTGVMKGKSLSQAKLICRDFQSLCTKGQPIQCGLDEDNAERLEIMSGVRDYPVRVKCATLAWHALLAAIDGGGIASTENENMKG